MKSVLIFNDVGNLNIFNLPLSLQEEFAGVVARVETLPLASLALTGCSARAFVRDVLSTGGDELSLTLRYGDTLQ